MPALESKETDGSYIVTGKNFEISISKSTGYIESYKVDGKEILTDGPKPNFYKAPISNDDTGNAPRRWNTFRNMADSLSIDTAQTTADVRAKVAIFNFTGTLPSALSGATEKLTYMITGGGDIVVDNTVIPNGSLGSLPRIGMRMMVADGYENVEYYGRGPWENYVDRKSGSKIGVYSATVDELEETTYVRPQNFANRTDVKWTSLVNEQGNGILVSSLEPFESSATHYIEEDMYQKRHWWQVEKQADTVLTVDMRIRGLGNASCAGSEALSQHQVNGAETWHQTFRISPITAATDKMEESKLNPMSLLPIQNLLVDGKPLAGFTPGNDNYEISLPPKSTRPPAVVSVVLADPESEVSIDQIEYYPGKATVTATSSAGLTSTYTINFKIIEGNFIYADELPVGGTAVDKNDWSNSHAVGWGILGICQCGANDHAKLNIRLSKDGTDSTVTGYPRGLGIHADGWVTFDTSGYEFEKFTSWIGINYCQISANANVIFRVQVMYEDGSIEEIFTSRPKRAATNGTVANGGLPEYIEVDIPKNVKAIRLHSDENGGNGNDHSVWADAKFTFTRPTWENIADYLAIPLEKSQQQGEMPKAPVGWEFELVGSADETLMNNELYVPSLSYSPREVQMTFKVTEKKADPQKTEERTITVQIPKIDADKTALAALLDQAKAMDEGDLIPESYAALQTAIGAADAVYNNATATQNEVDAAAASLQAVLDTLEEQPIRRVQESDEHLIYSAGWTDRVQINKFDKHIAKQASKKNETVSFTFKGNYFGLISYKSYSQGIFDVYVDGEKMHTVDLYEKGADASFKVPVAEMNLPYGEHTVTIVIVGKNPKSVGYNMYLDAVEIRGEFVEGEAGALVDDEVTVKGGKATIFDALLNDEVPAGTLIDSFTQPKNADDEIVGTVTLDNGLFSFTPNTIDLRDASFTYTVGGETATVTLKYVESGVRYEETFVSEDVVFGNAMKAPKWGSYKLAAYSGGSAKRSSQAGDTMTITFYGTGIDVIGYLSKSRGLFKVTLDGVENPEPFSCYDNSYDKLYKKSIYNAENLDRGVHTLTIEVLGKKAPKALGTAIDIDAFVVTK